MVLAKIRVTDVYAVAVFRKPIPAGIVGGQVEIEYASGTWPGLRKTVVFRGAGTKDVITDDTVVTIPAEVVAQKGVRFKVGIYGVDAANNLVIPTLWADIGIIQDAADPSGDTTTDPSLPVWAQLQAMIGDLDKLDTTVKNNLVAAVNEALTKGGGEVDEAEIQRIVVDYLAANPPASGATPNIQIGTVETLAAGSPATASIGGTPENPLLNLGIPQGLSGSGSVSSVCNVSPDSDGNVALTAENVGAMPTTGGDFTGAVNMNGQPISGLNDPTEDTQAARKGYVDASVRKAAPRNLLDNSDFRNPVNQRGQDSYTTTWSYTLDRWYLGNSGTQTSTLTINGDCITLSTPNLASGIAQMQQRIPADMIYQDKTHTFAWRNSAGDITITHLSPEIIAQQIATLGFAYVNIQTDQKSTEKIVWAALYEGEYTAETMPPYVPKGYGAELLECQRYYQIRSTNDVPAMDMRPLMRLASPTVTTVSGGYAYSADL